MSFVFDEPNLSATPFAPLKGGEDTGFLENFSAAYQSNLKLNRTDSRSINLREQWDPIIKEVQDKTGKKFFNPSNYLDQMTAEKGYGEKAYNGYSKQVFDFIKERPEVFPDLINLDNDALFEKAKKSAIKAGDVNADVAARQTLGGWFGDMAGGATAVLTDLPNLAITAGDLYLTRGSGTTILRESVRQAVLNGGAEAITQIEVADWYKTLDLPYDYRTFLANVGTAAVGAGVITAGVMGAKPAYQFTKKQMIDGIEALGKARANKEGRPYEIDPDIKMIKELDEIDATVNQGNVLKDDAGNLEHNARVDQSYDAVSNGDSTRITSAPPESAIVPPKDIYFHDNLNGEIFAYKPKDLLVDATLFQFKAGGDVMGVTERLQGISKWDPVKANTAIVYEFADGRTFIADGHQRLGLAKRLQEADPTQNIEIYAFKIREADGFDPGYARATAAGKNLAEGTGTLIDAAKIFRDAPELIKSLPPRSQFVKQANELASLSERAFGAVVNDIVPPHFGAIVGRYITEEAQQLAILQLLRRLEPANAVQAEQIVRQAKEAGFVKTEQAGLFGDEDIAESLFLERAKILDRAMKELRKDKQLFETLVKNANDIEQAGNTLAKLSNEEKEAIYGKAIAIIENNANVRGPISDDLTRIAKAWKDNGGTKIETYVRDFTESVRRAIESGSYERVPNGGDRGDLTTAPQSNRFTEPGVDELKGFDEGPGSIGAKNQGDILEGDLLGDMPNGGQAITVDEYVAKSINPEDMARLPSETQEVLRNLYQDAAIRKEQFDSINRDIANLVNAEYRSGDLKGSSRAVDKIISDYAGDATQIKDLLRSTIVVDNFQQAGVALRELRSRYQVLDSGFRNLLDPKIKALDGGYRDIKMNVNIDGHIAEVQITVPEFMKVKDQYHAKYAERDGILRRITDENRQPTKAELAQINKINGDMKQAYDDALAAVLNRSNSALSTGAPLRNAESAGKGLGEPLSQAAQKPSKPGTEPSVTGTPSTSRNSTFLDDFIKDTPDLTLAQIGTGGKRNEDLMNLEIPVAERIDPVTGERISEVTTVKDILADFEQDKSMLERLVGCVK
jgi:soluble cytochrome b562